jgi:hypothetical protein
MTTQVKPSADTLVSEREAAKVLGCTIFCLRAWRAQKINIPVVRIGRLVRYRVGDLTTYIQAHRIEVKA